MGIPEIIVILIIIVVSFVLLLLPFILREIYPNKFWVGTLLSFVLGPFGHNYLPKSGWWVVGLIFIFGIINGLTKDSNIAGFLTWIISGFAFLYRFRKKLTFENSEKESLTKTG